MRGSFMYRGIRPHSTVHVSTCVIANLSANQLGVLLILHPAKVPQTARVAAAWLLSFSPYAAVLAACTNQSVGCLSTVMQEAAIPLFCCRTAASTLRGKEALVTTATDECSWLAGCQHVTGPPWCSSANVVPRCSVGVASVALYRGVASAD